MSAEQQPVSSPEEAAPAAPSGSTAAAPWLAADLAEQPLLRQLSGVPLVPDHWHWLYRLPDGSLASESERREAETPLLGRFYVQGQTIIVWEPA
jgi:hypothetical protein